MQPKVFLKADWKYLAMINYEVDPAILAPFVPKGTELDLWNGKAFVSLVGFMFLNTYVKGIPIPFHRDFEEVNLRFYIKRTTPTEVKRGVAFIKEIVPKRIIAAVANYVYHENYISLPMRHRIVEDISDTSAEYEWNLHGNWQRLAVNCVGEPKIPKPGSDQEFFAEHYWGYSMNPAGKTLEYQVEHIPWRVWECQTCDVKINVEKLYDPAFAPFLNTPHSAFLAEGSPIIVRNSSVI